MSYNQNYEGDGISGGTTFKVGINKCVMKAYGLKAEEGKAPVLVTEWEDEEGSSITVWKFRTEDNEKNREFYNDYVDKSKTATFEEWLKDQKKNLYFWCKHVVCAYTSHEKFEEKVAALPKGATYEQFVNATASLLPQDYPSKKGQLKVGYTKRGKAYLSVPDEMYMGRFWRLDEDTREERQLDVSFNKYFKSEPFPTKEELRRGAEATGNAPTQNQQGEMNW